MKATNDILIPKDLVIETVFGCNLSCSMCSINLPTSRKKMIMSPELFFFIVDSMVPYRDQVERVDLYALGEPMLDPHLYDRISYLKTNGFKNLSISTNANLLVDKKQAQLLESGIETIIISIDGVHKTTHENIRKGANFDRVVENTVGIIRKRDTGNYQTRFIIRFIRQEANWSEWEEFKIFWNRHLSKEQQDFVAMYEMHNVGGAAGRKKDLISAERISEDIEKKPCHFIFECLIILSDGTVSLCHPDFHDPQFDLGKVPEGTPIEAFNSDAFNRVREKHRCGKKTELPICSECTIPYSESTREIG